MAVSPPEPQPRTALSPAETTELYRSFGRNLTGTAIGLFDRSMRWVFVEGDALLAELGTSKAQMEGRPVGDSKPVMRQALNENFERALDGQEQEFSFAHPNGRVLGIHVMPVRDGGEVTAGLVTFFDITTQKAAEAALRHSEWTQRVMTAHLPGTLVVMRDRDLNVLAVEGSSAVRARVGPELLGVDNQLSGDAHAGVRHSFLRALDGEQSTQDLQLSGGQSVYQTTFTPVADDNGHVFAALAVAVDVTNDRANARRLAFLAEYDELTQLPNRSGLLKHLNAVVEAVHAGEDSALFFIDLADFKAVNDTLGHEAGDSLLKLVAERITSGVRAGDIVARLSGDEFVVVLQSVAIPDEVAMVANRVLKTIGRPATVNGHELYPSATLGIGLLQGPDASAETALRQADMAMYEAKRTGSRTFCFYEPRLGEASRERLTLAADLNRALDTSELEIHYQPQLDVATGEVVSVEALLRWNHPQRGMVPPSEFIPIAEGSGLILRLGDWVLRQACRQNARWRKAGINLRVAVNVSPLQFRQGDICATVVEALAEAGLPPECLELELTESTLGEHENIYLALETLQQLGVALTIDDFGTGYSSLGRLKRFPLHVLKIDRGFVGGLPDDDDDVAIASAIITLAKTLGMTVLAEGVETADQERFLADAGCDLFSGWRFLPAVPAEEFERWLRERSPAPVAA